MNKTPLVGRVGAGSLSHSSQRVIDAINACQPTETIKAGGCGYKVVSRLNVFQMSLFPYTFFIGFTGFRRLCSFLCICFCWVQSLGYLCPRSHYHSSRWQSY